MENALCYMVFQKLIFIGLHGTFIYFFQAFKHANMDMMDVGILDIETSKQIADIQLTRTEFAEALQLKPTSLFVRNMFMLVDADRTGFISFKEFLDFFVVLSSGEYLHECLLDMEIKSCLVALFNKKK